MTSRSDILKKYAAQNYYDRTYHDFLGRLERGELTEKMLLPFDLYGSECITCEQKVTAFKYIGERYDLHLHNGYWIMHQCPPSEDECWPDDPNVRDGSGNLRAEGWSDDTWGEPQDLSDPKWTWEYPRVPYGGES